MPGLVWSGESQEIFNLSPCLKWWISENNLKFNLRICMVWWIRKTFNFRLCMAWWCVLKLCCYSLSPIFMNWFYHKHWVIYLDKSLHLFYHWNQKFLHGVFKCLHICILDLCHYFRYMVIYMKTCFFSVFFVSLH